MCFVAPPSTTRVAETHKHTSRGLTASFSTSIAGTTVHFTGMRVLNPDRSLLHGRGIPLDVVVRPSVEGIAAGKDEILEAALRLVN